MPESLRREQPSSVDVSVKGKKPERPCSRWGQFEWIEKSHWWERGTAVWAMRSDFLAQPQTEGTTPSGESKLSGGVVLTGMRVPAAQRPTKCCGSWFANCWTHPLR